MDAKNREGESPLLTASARGFVDIVECLVEHGAELETTDKVTRAQPDLFWHILLLLLHVFVRGLTNRSHSTQVSPPVQVTDTDPSVFVSPGRPHSSPPGCASLSGGGGPLPPQTPLPSGSAGPPRKHAAPHRLQGWKPARRHGDLQC